MQNTLVTMIGKTINITWSPPSVPNGMILQYIVQRINSSGKSYHHVSRDKTYLELPYFNDALVLVSAVNQYGQSSFEQAKSSGKKTIFLDTDVLQYGCMFPPITTQLLVCHLPVLIMEHVLL